MVRWLRPWWLLLAWPAVVAASPSDAFRDADCVDEIGLSRVAEEAGDDALRAHLAAPTPRQLSLIAVRASVHARAPERLLPALAKLACGRDPQLAPEAARATYQIAERLSADVLATREALKSELREARTSLRCAEQAPLPRADIVQLLAHAASALDAQL